ncbi:MAG: GPR endopeptidase [Clostridia bacterium]|nr:GPR endopeptidase [Clostridia bacterium]
MQTTKRTDLAREAVAIFQEDASAQTIHSGITAHESTVDGLPVYTVTVETEEGARAIGRPRGQYVTVEIDEVHAHAEHAFPRTVDALGKLLMPMLPPISDRPITVVGLGNRAVTPDALGPMVSEKILATRHLLRELPDQFGGLRPVTALTPGVLGVTGMESAEMILGVVETIHPEALILVDALAACDSARLCRTVQITDSGIAPGSGVGNRRYAINRQTVGIPCIAIGVPTVVDTHTLAADLLGEPLPESLKLPSDTFVTPKEIDRLVAECAKIITYAINRALQPSLTLADIELFLA